MPLLDSLGQDLYQPPETTKNEGLVWCCFMTPGLSKDIRCHV